MEMFTSSCRTNIFPVLKLEDNFISSVEDVRFVSRSLLTKWQYGTAEFCKTVLSTNI